MTEGTQKGVHLMSKATWYLTNEDEQDEDGYWYRRNPSVLGSCPQGWDHTLNITTVGWKREPRGNGYRETIRLPIGRELWDPMKKTWNDRSELGVHPEDSRCMSRQVRAPRRPDGNTIFDANGYLYKYFYDWFVDGWESRGR